MKKIWGVLVIIGVLSSFGCNKSGGSSMSSLMGLLGQDGKKITSFKFLAEDNTDLTTDVIGVIDETSITATVPYGVSRNGLIPTIEHTGVSIAPLNEAAQDFTIPVAYTVTSEDETTRVYTVTISEAPSDAKEILSFVFKKDDNASLSKDASGTISGNTISVRIPEGIERNGLIPEISISGSTISPASGVGRDFTSTVYYTVTAADNSEATYSVSVTYMSKNANLSNLVLSDGTLNPDFATNTTGYEAGVLNDIATVTVTPTAANNYAIITVNGSATTSGYPSSAVSLEEGGNTITVSVTSEDESTTKDYVVTITRYDVDIYFAGHSAGGQACYWKNSEQHLLPVTSTASDSGGSSIAVSGGIVYVAGRDSTGTVCYWSDDGVTPARHSLTTPSGYTRSIFVSGTDVYVAGSQGNYWKNGTRVDPYDYTGSVPEFSESYSIWVDSGKVYLEGYAYLSGTTYNGYIIQNETTGNGSTEYLLYGGSSNHLECMTFGNGHPYLAGYDSDGGRYWASVLNTGVGLGTDESSKAYAIALSGTNVYTAGYDSDGTLSRACYWRNGDFWRHILRLKLPLLIRKPMAWKFWDRIYI